jgi:hypothetical protein
MKNKQKRHIGVVVFGILCAWIIGCSTPGDGNGIDPTKGGKADEVNRETCDENNIDVEICLADGLDLYECINDSDSGVGYDLAVACCAEFDYEYCEVADPDQEVCNVINDDIEMCLADGIDLDTCINDSDSGVGYDNAIFCCEKFGYDYCNDDDPTPPDESCSEIYYTIQFCLADGLELYECINDPDSGVGYDSALACCAEFDYDYCEVIDLNQEVCNEADENIEICLADGLDLYECINDSDSGVGYDLALACCAEFGYDYCEIADPDQEVCDELNDDIEMCLADGLDLDTCINDSDSGVGYDNATFCCDKYGYDYCNDPTPNVESCSEIYYTIQFCLADGLDLYECINDSDSGVGYDSAMTCCAEYDYDYCEIANPDQEVCDYINEDIQICLADGLELFTCINDPYGGVGYDNAMFCCQSFNYDYCN